jgi:hypothetical protein
LGAQLSARSIGRAIYLSINPPLSACTSFHRQSMPALSPVSSPSPALQPVAQRIGAACPPCSGGSVIHTSSPPCHIRYAIYIHSGYLTGSTGGTPLTHAATAAAAIRHYGLQCAGAAAASDGGGLRRETQSIRPTRLYCQYGQHGCCPNSCNRLCIAIRVQTGIHRMENRAVWWPAGTFQYNTPYGVESVCVCLTAQ